MYNVLEQIPQVTQLVQVGIRDFCQDEAVYVATQDTRVNVFYDDVLFERKSHGEPWHGICQDIIRTLPTKVWISFDIDGLDPRFCPHTGTPVPGGLDFREALAIIRAVVESGRTIIGFDLNEVAPGPKGDEWDGNVGARLLYKMSGYTLKSQGLL
jgi:agmatinase